LKKVFIASDHAGYKLKKNVISKFSKKQKIVDLGPESNVSVDYPDYAHKLSKKISANKGSFGILICGSGMGMSITANKNKKSEQRYVIAWKIPNYLDCIITQISLH